MHTRQRYPTEKRAHESSATKHQQKHLNSVNKGKLPQITTDQMFVQEKFHPEVITSNWCFRRPPESCEGLFKIGKSISSSTFWRQQYSPKQEIQHLAYQKPCFSGLLKTVAQRQVSRSTGLWQSSNASLELTCCYSFIAVKKVANICPVAEGSQHPFNRGQG